MTASEGSARATEPRRCHACGEPIHEQPREIGKYVYHAQCAARRFPDRIATK